MQHSDTEIRPNTGRLRYKLLCGGLILVNILLLAVIYLLTTYGQTIYDWLPQRQQYNEAQAATTRTDDEMFIEQLYTTLQTVDDRLLADKAREWYAGHHDREYGEMGGSADYIDYDYTPPEPKVYYYT